MPGIGATFYKSQKEGIELFIEGTNAAGGFLGKKLELVVRDAQLTDPQRKMRIPDRAHIERRGPGRHQGRQGIQEDHLFPHFQFRETDHHGFPSL